MFSLTGLFLMFMRPLAIRPLGRFLCGALPPYAPHHAAWRGLGWGCSYNRYLFIYSSYSSGTSRYASVVLSLRMEYVHLIGNFEAISSACAADLNLNLTCIVLNDFVCCNLMFSLSGLFLMFMRPLAIRPLGRFLCGALPPYAPRHAAWRGLGWGYS